MEETAACRIANTLRRFPQFAELPHGTESRSLERESRLVVVRSTQILANQGRQLRALPVVVSGEARVYAVDSDGRELTLFRLLPGDACAVAAISILDDTPAPASCVVDCSGKILMIPASALRSWLAEHDFWRRYLFSLISRQFAKTIELATSVGLQKLDHRIAGYLSGHGPVVSTTHNDLAAEFGTRREVVSRILKSFEREGMVTLARGQIHVVDADRLQALPASGH